MSTWINIYPVCIVAGTLRMVIVGVGVVGVCLRPHPRDWASSPLLTLVWASVLILPCTHVTTVPLHPLTMNGRTYTW